MPSDRKRSSGDSAVAIGAAAVLAHIFADGMHEVIGHAGTCWHVGGRIRPLTSNYFRGPAPTYAPITR